MSSVYDTRSISSSTYILDHFDENRIVVNNHGDKVKSVYDKCTNSRSSIGRDHGYWNGYKWKINGNTAINDITKSRKKNTLYNMSFGPTLDEKNESLKWSQATEKQQTDYIAKQQKQIKDVVFHQIQE